jgi:Flp pilus assembly protein TadG
MIRSQSNRDARTAAIAPLTAVLLIPLLAMAAFAVDIGWISLTQSDLQNAADSAALAAASQLTNGFVSYNLPGQSAVNQNSILNTSEAAARTYAKNFAGYNRAGNVTLTTLPNADVEFGSTDASGNYTTPAVGYPNTVKVTVRRDATANGPLRLFFGPILGLSSVNLKATAASAVYAVTIDSFSNNANFKLNLLPITYDVNNWNNFIATGADPDGNVTKDSSGSPQLNIYPSVKDSGNFGLLSLDGSHAGASTVSSWISDGMQQSEVQGLLSAGGQTPLMPLSQHNPNILPQNATDGMGSWNWIGDTGMKTSVLHTLSGYTGNTFILPLFQPLNGAPGSSYTAGNGQGSNYYYNIVKFVSLQVIYVDNKSVIVVPGATVVNLDNVILGTAATPAVAVKGGSGAALPTTFAPPKLSQ